MSNTIFPVLPLRDVVVFPQVIIPLFVGRKKSINALDKAMLGEQELLLIPQLDPKQRDPNYNDLHPIGTVGRIVQMAKLSDGTIKVLIEGLQRVHIKNYTDSDEFMQAEVSPLTESNQTEQDELQAMIHTAIEQFKNYLKIHEKSADELIETLRELKHAGRIADTIIAHMDIDIADRISILTQLDIGKRLQQVLVFLEQEHEKAELDAIIRKRVKQQMERNQREYYLNEQMKAIQKELGEMDEAQNDIELLEKSNL